jgi:hypothetical protein
MSKEKAKVAVGEYIQNLKGRGFPFGEEQIGFIYFGMEYTNAHEELVKTAIEITLKVQKHFDGSFYISLLESFKKANISSKKAAYAFVESKKLL